MAEKKATFTYGDGKKAVITIEPQVNTKVVMLKGDDGMTSYELAVKYLGFSGTLEDWIKAYTTPEDYFTRDDLKMVTQAEYDELKANNKLVAGCYYFITDDTTLEDLETAITKAKEEAEDCLNKLDLRVKTIEENQETKYVNDALTALFKADGASFKDESDSYFKYEATDQAKTMTKKRSFVRNGVTIEDEADLTYSALVIDSKADGASRLKTTYGNGSITRTLSDGTTYTYELPNEDASLVAFTKEKITSLYQAQNLAYNNGAVLMGSDGNGNIVTYQIITIYTSAKATQKALGFFQIPYGTETPKFISVATESTAPIYDCYAMYYK